jgi:hypothetical protein
MLLERGGAKRQLATNRRILSVHAFSRRSLLVNVAALTATTAVVERGSADVPLPVELQALIVAHKAAYGELDRLIHQIGSGTNDRDRADRVEQEALLAICSYRAVGPLEQKTKAEYLLTVEARGELDLQEHMQALLHSML